MGSGGMGMGGMGMGMGMGMGGMGGGFNPFAMPQMPGFFRQPGAAADAMFGGPLRRPTFGIGPTQSYGMMGGSYEMFLQQEMMQMQQWQKTRVNMNSWD